MNTINDSNEWSIVFRNKDHKEVGRLFLNKKGKLDFEGDNVTESRDF